MPQMTLAYDPQTEKLLRELAGYFGVRTKAGVIRRSLAICRAAKKYSDETGAVRMENPTTGKGETFALRTA